VPEVPGERAEDRRVDPIELLVGEGLDEPKRPLAGLGEARGDSLFGGRSGEGDWRRLPISAAVQ
jgi:hypothetical protein